MTNKLQYYNMYNLLRVSTTPFPNNYLPTALKNE